MGDITSWIGTILQILVTIGTIGAFFARLHIDLKLLVQSQLQMKNTIDAHEAHLKQMGQILIDLARQDIRLTSAETRLHEISARLYDHIRREENSAG